jgi:RHS repeat-associated protein
MNAKSNTKLLTGKALAAIIFSVCLCLIVPSINSAQASTTVSERVDFSRAMPEENVEDMSVKVLGGSISVNRFYRVMKRNPDEAGYPGVSGDLQGYNGNTLQSEAFLFEAGKAKRNDFAVWQFHRRWHDLLFVETRVGYATTSGGSSSDGSTTGSGPSSGGSSLLESPKPRLIDRNDYLYELKDGEDYYVYEHNGNDLRITITDTGFRWSNRQGDWIDYDQEGLATRSGNKNGVSINLVRENGFITHYKDHFGNTVVTWEYLNGKPVKATDYDGRVVEYKWQGHDLVEVTTTRGHKWKYGYSQIGLNRVMTSKTDPENQTFLYEFQQTEGGFQYSTPSSGGPDVTLIGDDTPVAISSGGSSGGSSNQASFSVPVEPTLMHTAMIYPDGKRVRYQYRYDPQSESYMILEVNSDGVERERWYDLDGQVRYHLVGGRVAGTRIRSGQVAVARDVYGRRTSTKFTRHEAVESITYADGAKVSYKYLSNYNFPLLRTDQIGIETKYQYDFKGNRIRTSYGFNTNNQRIVEYDYDLFGQITAMRHLGSDETPTAQVRYEYDNYGNLTKKVDARGNTTEFKEYNSGGQFQVVIDARSKEWSIAYDEFSNKIRHTSPSGFVSTYEYDRLHRLVKSTDPEGRKQEFLYDSRNYRIAAINNLGGEAKFNVRMDGQVKASQDEIGRIIDYDYDRVGRLTGVTDAVGNRSSLYYIKQDEVAGNRVARIEGANFSSSFVYDSLYRLTELTQLSVKGDGLSTTTHYEYNLRGEMVSSKDGNGNITRWTYTSHGEQASVINAQGEVVANAYDTRGNLISVTDPLGHEYRFNYDLNSNVASEHRPMGEVQLYSYDANNNLTLFSDYIGNRSAYTYDDDNRLLLKSDRKLSTDEVQRLISYTFDKSGLPKSLSDTKSSVEYKYDELRRLEEQTTVFITDELPITKKLKNSYYKNSQLKSRTDAEGITSVFSYDAAGKFKQVNIQNAGTINVASYEGAFIKSIAYPGGLDREYSYDGLSRISSIQVADNAGNKKMEYRYDYDNVGNINERTTQQGTYSYTYDRAHRLISAKQPSIFGDQTYKYDENSNRIELVNSEGTNKYIYNENHELVSIKNTLDDINKETALSYDANGSLLSESVEGGDTTKYNFNGYGRLDKVEKNNLELATYEYDPQGRRLSKTVNGETTYFLYDDTGASLVGEYGASGDLIRSYSYSSSRYYSTNPVFQKTVKADGGYEFNFYQNDILGSPQLMIDSTGSVTWQGEYDAFGKMRTIIENKANPLRFPGQYYDGETGFHQNWRRNYHPSTGRYISSDPTGLAGGINTYGYVEANPLIKFDPKGEHAILIAAGIAAWWAGCTAYSVGESLSEYPNGPNSHTYDDKKHCYASCLLNKCTGFLAIPAFAIGLANEGMNGTFDHRDIDANVEGIMASYRGDCYNECENCEIPYR